MSKEKRRVPKLRFPGFTEDWEQRKLGEFVKIVSGDAPSTFISGNCIYVKVDDLNYSDRIQLSSSNLVNANPKAHLVNQGATIFPKRGAAIMTNKVRIMGKDGYLDTNMMALIPEEIDKDFLFTFIQKTGLYKIADTSTIPQINNKHIEPYMIQVPSEKEQAYIGVIFKKIDKIITLHQRKLDNLKLKKKALLQKLFPKNGERYPELRFSGFTDAWEQRKLGSIGSTYTGLSGKTKEDFGHGEAKYITYLNVFQNTISNITMTDKVEIDPTQNEVKYGDVLFTTSSETPEEVGMSSVWLGDTPNIYLNSFCFGFRPNQKIDSYFLGYSLRAPYMRDRIKILAQGISRYNISKNKVMELEISLPNNEEQKLLGTFLQRIDLIITLHQRKLDHLKLQKKALLQQMFV